MIRATPPSAGVFVHAAPWDHVIGRTDTSHGCIHLSTAGAHRFYDFSRTGDTIVKNTGSLADHQSGP